MCLNCVFLLIATLVALVLTEPPSPRDRPADASYGVGAAVTWQLPRDQAHLLCMTGWTADPAACPSATRIPPNATKTSPRVDATLRAKLLRMAFVAEICRSVHAALIFTVLFAAVIVCIAWLLFRSPIPIRSWERLIIGGLVIAVIAADCVESQFLLDFLSSPPAKVVDAHHAPVIEALAIVKWSLTGCLFLSLGVIAARRRAVMIELGAFASALLMFVGVVGAAVPGLPESLPLAVLVSGVVFGAMTALGVASAWNGATDLATTLLHGNQGWSRSIDELIALELGEKDLDAPRVGLALSGGGIRSATYGLGLMSALDEAGLLRFVSYLATVSGGGYIGGFWTRWRHWNRDAKDVDPKHVFPHRSDAGGHRALTHLRQFSRFLSPRLGVLSLDTGRLFGAVIGAMVPGLVAGGSVLVLALTAWLGVASYLVSNGMLSLVLVPAVLGVTLGALELSGLRRTRGTPAFGQRLVSYAVATTLACVAAGLLWGTVLLTEAQGAFAVLRLGLEGATRGFDAVSSGGRLAIHLRTLPSLSWVFAVVPLVGLRFLLSGLMSTYDGLKSPRSQSTAREAISAVDRVTTRSLLLGGVWAVTGLVFWLAEWIHEQHLTLEAVTAAVTSSGLFAYVRSLFGAREGRDVETHPLVTLIRPKLPALLAGLTVLATAVAIAAMLAEVGRVGNEAQVLLPAGIAFGGLVISLILLDPNTVGLHDFYRSRIVRAFLGASNPRQKSWQTEEGADDDILIHEIPEGAGPLHLVCCCANDVSGDPLLNLGRGSRSAALSRVALSVGDDWAGWESCEDIPTLGRALTASAAAFNSLMGSASMHLGPAVGFLMSTMNLRLGTWLPHPRAGAPPLRWPVGLRYFQEMFMRARADGMEVHLSDGGHFENMAVFELLRRRCQYVLAADCGADPSYVFADLGNLIRRAREALGIEIEIDVDALVPRRQEDAEAPPRAERHFAVGTIRYPDGPPGILLIFKPTLTGNEPVDILNYSEQNLRFPQETTGDQFYDEAQWESYRRLGEHAVRDLIPRDKTFADLEMCRAMFERALAAVLMAPGEPSVPVAASPPRRPHALAAPPRLSGAAKRTAARRRRARAQRRRATATSRSPATPTEG